eukprot:1608191-Rhodomonas_salina.1
MRYCDVQYRVEGVQTPQHRLSQYNVAHSVAHSVGNTVGHTVEDTVGNTVEDTVGHSLTVLSAQRRIRLLSTV